MRLVRREVSQQMTANDAIVVVDDDSAVRDSLGSLIETAGFSVQLYE